jgi:hypothetical protein
MTPDADSDLIFLLHDTMRELAAIAPHLEAAAAAVPRERLKALHARIERRLSRGFGMALPPVGEEP